MNTSHFYDTSMEYDSTQMIPDPAAEERFNKQIWDRGSRRSRASAR
jgi:hypothetical protein